MFHGHIFRETDIRGKKIEKCMGLTKEDEALFLEFYGILWFYDFIERLHAFMVTETVLFCQINLFRLQLEREWSNVETIKYLFCQFSGKSNDFSK